MAYKEGESFDVLPADTEVTIVEPNGEEVALGEASPNLKSAQALLETLNRLSESEIAAYIPEIKSKIDVLEESGVTSPEVESTIAFLQKYLEVA